MIQEFRLFVHSLTVPIQKFYSLLGISMTPRISWLLTAGIIGITVYALLKKARWYFYLIIAILIFGWISQGVVIHQLPQKITAFISAIQSAS